MTAPVKDFDELVAVQAAEIITATKSQEERFRIIARLFRSIALYNIERDYTMRGDPQTFLAFAGTGFIWILRQVIARKS